MVQEIPAAATAAYAPTVSPEYARAFYNYYKPKPHLTLAYPLVARIALANYKDELKSL
jgi:hypothetical protein